MSGGQATIVFETADGGTATGRVLASTDVHTLGLGPATLALEPYGMARLISRVSGDEIVLCGPRYSQEAPPEVQDTFPCGA